MTVRTEPRPASATDDTLRIGFVTVHKAADTAAYSGTAAAMRDALRRRKDVQLFTIDGLRAPLYLFRRAKQAAYWFGLRRRYWMNRDPAVLRSYGRQVAMQVKALGTLDALLSPSSLPLALYEGNVPTTFWTDATFGCLDGFYPDFSQFAPETKRAGNAMEAEALRRCAAAIYSSRWAADSAVSLYGADPATVFVVPYGPNVETAQSRSGIEMLIRQRIAGPIHLLFVGTDWKRKGGAVAVAAVAELQRQGIDARLNIVGCMPPAALPPFAEYHGFLRKDTPESSRRLDALYREATLLLLPTRADCVPVVVAEAYSHGLPVIATDVGGMSSVIIDHVTGRLLPLIASASEWAIAAKHLVLSQQAYANASLAAFDLFQSKLNWHTAVEQVLAILRQRCGHRNAA